jgi:hypothetical protein
MDDGLLALKLALLLFWAAWFAVVFLANAFGVLKAMGALPRSWPFASTNYQAVVKATAMYRPPAWVPSMLFAGVLAWQLAVAALFAWAAGAWLLEGRLEWRAVNLAFGGGIALWGAFMLADEIVLKYEFERTHELLFIAQLASLIAMHALPGFPPARE